MQTRIPGTCMEDTGASGAQFLEGIFSATSGIVLSQVREISGLDTSTIQNLIKRGWVSRPVGKRYDQDQLARILLINMLRNVMQIENISFLLTYINGDVDDHSDDIIPESRLFDMVCRIFSRWSRDDALADDALEAYVQAQIAGYEEHIPGSRSRIAQALRIILTAYKAALLREQTLCLLAEIRSSACDTLSNEKRREY